MRLLIESFLLGLTIAVAVVIVVVVFAAAHRSDETWRSVRDHERAMDALHPRPWSTDAWGYFDEIGPLDGG